MPGYYEDNEFFISDFDESLETLIIPLTKESKNQARYRDGFINLTINSHGGYEYLVNHFIALVEMAHGLDVTMRTIVPAAAYSAGSMLAITGTPGERYIGPNAQHLVHYGYTGSSESTPLQVERSTKAKIDSFKKTLEHYRSYANIPNLDQEMLDDGFFIPSRQCIKWGLADKPLSKLPQDYVPLV